MNKRYLIAILGVLISGCLVVSTPLFAQPAERVDRHTFFESDNRTVLSQPTRVDVRSETSVMIWDRGLQSYLRVNPTALQSSETEAQSIEPLRSSELLEARKAMRWFPMEDPEGFWGQSNQYWTFQADARESTGALTVETVGGDERISLPEHGIRSVVSRSSYWYLQPDTGPLIKWDPHASNGRVDTGPALIRGRLFDIGPNGRIYTRSDREIRVYSDGQVEQSRVFQQLKSMARSKPFLYVLTGQNRILKLDENLSVQFTYRLPNGLNPVDLDVRNNRIYFVGTGGFHVAKLDESQSSFFSSSQDLDIERVLGSFPDVLDTPKHRRLWANKDRLYLNRREGGARAISAHDTGFSESRANVSMDDLPLNPFQYFQTDATFWNGTDRLYYFFPDERTVESYDREGQIVRRSVLEFDEFNNLRNVGFIGADRNRIIFEGDVIYPEYGYERTVLIYTWDGELKRAFRPQKPSGISFSEAVAPSANWEYDGQGHLFVLGGDYVQQYDLRGYPGQTIADVSRPTDVLRVDDTLYVMDLNGWRLSQYTLNDDPVYRFGTPPTQLAIMDAESSGDGGIVLAGREPGDDQHDILEYNPNTFNYQTVFEHPNQSLRHPEVAAGDTLFFWGRRSGSNPYQLFVSDLQQFAARPTGIEFSPAGSGTYDRERDLLLVPQDGSHIREKRSSADTGIYYTNGSHPMKGLVNSDGLKDVVPGGFTGYYGVVNSDDGDVIVTGYLQRGSDTSNWQWTTSDTIVRSPYPIEQISLRDGRLYLTRRVSRGVSELGVVRIDGDERRDVRPLYRLRGDLRWIRPGDDRSLILHKTSRNRGNVALLYHGEAPTGGAQGQLVTSSPASLADIQLRTDPGGIRFQTEAGGSFSVDGLPVGYVRIMTEGYEKHFSYPVRARIKPDQFTLLSEVSVEVEEELLLLERGLGYFNEGQFRRSRIALEAYRNLVEEGPYYRMAGIYLKEIYQRQGEASLLTSIYRESPGLFDERDRRALYEMVQNKKAKRDIIQGFDEHWHPFLSEFKRYRLRLLENTSGSTGESVTRPYRFKTIGLFRNQRRTDTESPQTSPDTATSP